DVALEDANAVDAAVGSRLQIDRGDPRGVLDARFEVEHLDGRRVGSTVGARPHHPDASSGVVGPEESPVVLTRIGGAGVEGKACGRGTGAGHLSGLRGWAIVVVRVLDVAVVPVGEERGCDGSVATRDQILAQAGPGVAGRGIRSLVARARGP